jgi:hypothetical protein
MYVPPSPSAASERAPGPAATGATFAASDLIDADSLPQWVRGQDGGGASFSSTEGWTSKGPSAPLALGSGPIGGGSSGYTDHQPASQAMPVDERFGSEDSSWFSGRQAASMGERPDSGLGTGNFGRGAPIPREELPAWLRTDVPGDRAAARGMAARQMPAWDEPAASPYGDEHEQYGVDAGDEAAPAWDDGGYDQPYDQYDHDQPYDQQFDGGYGGGYEGGYGAVDEYGQPMPGGWDEGYGDYDDYDGAREPRRGFWGRLFGRG